MSKTTCSKTEAWGRIVSRFSSHVLPEDVGSVLDWGKKFLPHYFQCEPSRMHHWISEIVGNQFERRNQKALVIGPRGGAKSTVSTLTYVLKKAVEGLEPYILIVGDTEEQSIQNLTNLKLELEGNAYGLADTYPGACGQGPIWQQNYIRLRNGVVIHALGTGQSIRGRRFQNNRPTLIVADDLENDSHIESQLKRDRMESWFNRTLLNMGDERTNFLVLGSALHQNSLLMRLRRRPGWISKRDNGKPSAFKAIERWPDRMDLWEEWEKIYSNADNENAERDAHRFYKKNKKEMTKGAVLCWPDREPLLQLMKHRAAIGHTAFEGEKQGNPIDPAGCEWPERYFTGSDFYFEEWPEDLLVKGQALDPSKGKKDDRHDFSAIAWGGVSASGVVYVDLDLAKRPAEEIVDDSLAIYSDFNPQTFAIETNQFQELLADDIAEKAEEIGLGIHITPVENFISKRVRIRRLGTLLSQRRIRFKANSEGASKCIQQLREFPLADHDDGPDALETLCRCMFAMLEDSREVEDNERLQKVMGAFL